VNRHRQGFTLLELLLVISIIAVIASVGFNAFIQYRKAQYVRESQVQFAQTVERARSLTRRFSRFYQIEIRPPVASPKKNYSYRISPREFQRDYVNGTTQYPEIAATDTNKPPVVEVVLPEGISLYDVAGNKKLDTTQTLRFAAPFGRSDSAATFSLCFLNDGSNNVSGEVQVLGVTAKVVTRGIKSGNTPCR
jgi:prepilin-type N-terminal cleavage/methylation domain-containing protein